MPDSLSSKELTEQQFTHTVYLVLYDHPEWFMGVVRASQQATLDKLEEHSERRARAEGALSMAIHKTR